MILLSILVATQNNNKYCVNIISVHCLLARFVWNVYLNYILFNSISIRHLVCINLFINYKIIWVPINIIIINIVNRFITTLTVINLK